MNPKHKGTVVPSVSEFVTMSCFTIFNNNNSSLHFAIPQSFNALLVLMESNPKFSILQPRCISLFRGVVLGCGFWVQSLFFSRVINALGNKSWKWSQFLRPNRGTVKRLYDELCGTDEKFRCTSHFVVAVEHVLFAPLPRTSQKLLTQWSMTSYLKSIAFHLEKS